MSARYNGVQSTHLMEILIPDVQQKKKKHESRSSDDYRVNDNDNDVNKRENVSFKTRIKSGEGRL